MNKVILMGRLTKDMEVRRGQDGTAVARGAMAIDRGKKKDGTDMGADFPSLVAFGKTAEFFEKYGTKGRKFLVEGRIQTGSYTNKDGAKVYTTDVIVDRTEFADSKPENATAPAAQPSVDANGFMNIPDGIDEELPFN